MSHYSYNVLFIQMSHDIKLNPVLVREMESWYFISALRDVKVFFYFISLKWSFDLYIFILIIQQRKPPIRLNTSGQGFHWNFYIDFLNLYTSASGKSPCRTLDVFLQSLILEFSWWSCIFCWTYIAYSPRHYL